MDTRVSIARRGDESAICVKMVNHPGYGPVWPAPNEMRCGAVIPLHGYHWVHEVCPKCLANYFYGWGSDTGLYPDFGATYDAATRTRVVENIQRNAGRYIPTF